MTRGTCYFPSFTAAVVYYEDYHYKNTRAAVLRKLMEEEIHIGLPPVTDGERVICIDGGLRYGITPKEAP